MKIRILGWVALAAGLTACAGDFVIAERGRPAACSIVLPAQASESQKYAAQELQSYTKRMTGVELPILAAGAPQPARGIFIGGGAAVAKLGDDGFRLVVRPPHLYVQASSVRGCLYGVYELLERFGGCRWYASWHTVVPEKASFAVPETLDVAQKPDFLMRSSWWFDVNTHNDFAARLRVNTRPWGTMEAKFGGDSFRFCRDLQSCHTFNALIPPSKYQKEHPEYFSRTSGDYVQPCLTHPDVLAIVTSNVLKHIRCDPTAKVYGVSQNDWYNYCTCPRCKAVDAEEGSHAGTMVRFVNAIAEAVEREYPGKIIETLAYQYTRQPPTKTKLRHNVVPCLCTIECDFAYAIPESRFHQNKSFMKDIEGWSPMTDQLYIWDYVTNFRHYPYPFPNCYALQGNLRFFRDSKAKEMFPEGDYQGNLADFAELKAWLLAKWMWNADLPMKELLDDFFAGYYGKGAPFVRAYFEELHQIQRAASAKADHPLLIFEAVGASTFSDAFFEKAAGLFDQAKAAVKDEPAVYARNVRGTAFSVDYTRFMRMAGKANCLLCLSREQPTLAMHEKAKRLAQSMLAVIDEFGNVRLSESAAANDREYKLLRDAANSTVQELPRAVTRGCIEEKDLKYCRTPSMGGFVDDPKAEDGRALKLNNNHYEWSTEFSLSSVKYDPGRKLRVRVRCRVERKPGRTGEAIWAGIYDWGRRTGACERDVRTEEIATDEYVWYDVGTFVPNDTQTFWIGPGRFGKDGKSNINALYVDKLELSIAEP